MKRTLVVLLCLGLLALPVGFLPDGFLGERFPPRGVDVSDEPAAAVSRPDARRRYLDALAADDAVAGGARTAWRRAGEDALAAPLPMTLPYGEHRLLGGAATAGGGEATAFEVSLSPPAVLHLRTVAGVGAAGGLLVDVLQRRGERFAPLVTLGPADIDLRWSPPVGGRYLVRVQPALSSIGAFSLALASRPPLDFPVLTDATDPVRSRFGVPRDGGRREHHGIDIFAPRGTPVLAAADGMVVRTGDSGRGGLHVWQRAEDEAGRHLGSLYYAHLDRIDVPVGTRVTRGTPLGTVGNTGNARTTPPHLHFGLYRRYRGPVDPLPLVGERRELPAPLPRADGVAPWLAVRSPVLNLRAGPGTGNAVLGQLAGGDLVRAVATSGGWARVRARSASGVVSQGYVSRGAARRRRARAARAGAGSACCSPRPRRERRDSVCWRPERRLRTAARSVATDVSGTPDGLQGWLAPEGESAAAIAGPENAM